MTTCTLVKAGIRGGTAPHHKWTDEEKEIVRRDYNGTKASAQVIADRLGITLYGVRGQVHRMGIAKNSNRRPWTPEEKERLAKLIERHASATVAKMMHRGVNSVVVQSKRQGLSWRIRDGWFTKQEVCEILGVDHHWIQKRIDIGALKATFHNGTRPQQHGGVCWHIEQGDLYDFIRKYPQELTGRNVDIMMIVEILAGISG